MARKQRIHYPGAIYHVMVRGNNGEKILLDENQKKKYIDIIAQYKEKLDFNILAFCIMDNHAHILIKVKEVPLSQIMQRIQQVYTQWYNRKYNRTGHVFQQRYKALLCAKNNYLLQLIKYIHQNPVKANLNGGLEYEWSSHIYYLRKKEGSFVDIGFVLSMFSSKEDEMINKYLEFMDQPQGEIRYLDIQEIQDKMHDQQIEKTEERKFNMDSIIEEICQNEGVELNKIVSKTKIQKISDIRKAIVLLCDRYCNIPKKEIADKLNLPQSMVSKIVSGERRGTPYVQDIIRRWKGIRE